MAGAVLDVRQQQAIPVAAHVHIAALLLLATVPACGASHSFTVERGAIAAGGDIERKNMTIPAAQVHCETLPSCAGFTLEHNGTTDLGAIYSVYFKSSMSVNMDRSWWSWIKRQQDCPSVKLVWQPSYTQINASSAGPENASAPTQGPAAPGNRGGLEDGIVVRRADGKFSMIAAEMYAGGWVSMRLGVWESPDGLEWSRVRSLRASTGKDNSGPHAASWGPFFVHDPANDTWVLSYVGYRSAGSNNSGWLENFDGTIFYRYATVSGDAGLTSDFGEDGDIKKTNMSSTAFAGDRVLIAPDDFKVNGPWPHQCQGLQGTDSFYPFRLNETHWAGFAGTSQQQKGFNGTTGKWPVSLATAPALAGPWVRYNPTDPSHPADAPCVDINGGNTENPIVSRRPDDSSAFHMVYDDLSAERRGFGYACSQDGLTWEHGVNVALPDGARTPFGLVPLTRTEKAARRADILAAGVLTAADLNKTNTSLQWVFYTGQHFPTAESAASAVARDTQWRSQTGGWEGFKAGIVQLAW